MTNTNSSRRQELYSLLGDLPQRDRSITVVSREVEERPFYQLEKLVLDLNGIENVPAYFVKPLNTEGPLPVVLFNHSHGGAYDRGKDELLNGCDYLYKKPYAEELTGMGYAVLCIDTWCFGQRNHSSESETFKAMLWQGQVLWGMMVYDSIRAVDYLVSRDDVDADRVATLGMSMGSTMSWWLTALDLRIKLCVDICCMTDFQTLLKLKRLDCHGLFYYVPSLLKHFSTAQINALIAPRPHLSLAGNNDILTPPEGLDIIDMKMNKVYRQHGAASAWQMLRYDSEHIETKEMRKEIVSFLEKWV